MDGNTPIVEHDSYSDDYIRRILGDVKTIAMVGASANWNRPSYFAMKYLQQKGFRVIPVNPTAAGKTILGERVHSSLEEIGGSIDMVDVFRPAEECPNLAEQAVRMGARVLWMQLGIRSDEAARIAEGAGLRVVMNRCPKIEFARLHGELGWNGINSKVITSKRRRI